MHIDQIYRQSTSQSKKAKRKSNERKEEMNEDTLSDTKSWSLFFPNYILFLFFHYMFTF